MDSSPIKEYRCRKCEETYHRPGTVVKDSIKIDNDFNIGSPGSLRDAYQLIATIRSICPHCGEVNSQVFQKTLDLQEVAQYLWDKYGNPVVYR